MHSLTINRLIQIEFGSTAGGMDEIDRLIRLSFRKAVSIWRQKHITNDMVYIKREKGEIYCILEFCAI